MDYETIEAGRELDCLIAEKVMGWHWFVPHGVMTELPPEHQHIGGWCNLDGSLAHGLYNRWQPSTNIAHAWEVVEKLSDPCNSFRDYRGFPAGTVFMYKWSGMDLWASTASEAALNICRVALQIVSSTAEQGNEK